MPRTYSADLIDEPGLAGRAGAAVARLRPNRRSDLFMLLVAGAASVTVLVNALALQGGRHISIPLPSFPTGDAVPLPVPVPPEARQGTPTPPPAPVHETAAAAPGHVARPLPRPAPAAAPATAPVAAKPAVPPKPVATPARPAAPTMPVTTAAKPTASAAPAPSGLDALSAEITGSVRPPVDVEISPRVLAVQKALADIGYGPIRIDGRAGAATREAVERFERDRRLPISGEVSDRLVRELNAVAGTRIE